MHGTKTSEHPCAAVQAASTTVRADFDGNVFAQRPRLMKSHGGKVSLPGCKMDDDDVNLGTMVRTALGEAQEVVGH